MGLVVPPLEVLGPGSDVSSMPILIQPRPIYDNLTTRKIQPVKLTIMMIIIVILIIILMIIIALFILGKNNVHKIYK